MPGSIGSVPNRYCKDCGKKLAGRKSIRCRSCASKEVHRRPSYKKKFSETMSEVGSRRRPNPVQFQAKLDKRLIDVCLNCELPKCVPHSVLCPYPKVYAEIRAELATV
jgi:hypothetical protein